jgi:hypothetical protein
MKKILLLLFFIILSINLIYNAENRTTRIRSLQKTMSTNDVWLDVNRMNGFYRNNGIWLFDALAGDWGLEWPKGSGNSPMFACGQWLGAVVGGEVRVAGIQHSATEYQPGEITAPFQAANPKDSKYRWYVVKSDGSGDWTGWPVEQGAPVDESGKPLLLGDMTMFSIWNDMAEHGEYATKKLSAEVRQLVFAFNRQDALGDMQFIKWQITNKSGMNWDSTYFAIWADPDLGNALDDFVGCDTVLGLGYCYNADDDDQNYGTAPPAIGIDFFQGPVIDQEGSTVSLPDGSELADKRMLKMTSYVYYNNDDSPQGNPHSGGDIWNYFRGYWRDNSLITEGGSGTSSANPPTSFMFTGDPEQASGWLDTDPDDRRFLMTTGPFDMPPWEDTNGDGLPTFGEPGVQEIVACVLVARGTNNLNSVTTLKQVDELAQLAYDLNFKLAKPPLIPEVRVSELPNEIILNWTDISEFNENSLEPYFSGDPIVAEDFGKMTKLFTIKDVPSTENPDSMITVMDSVVTVVDDSTYNFYGYSVYQFSDAAGSDPVLVDHWDVGRIHDPTTYNGSQFIRLLENKHNKVDRVGNRLVNGKEYYFGVVAEGYLEYGSPKVLPSPTEVLTVIPQIKPGIRLDNAQFNDTLDVEHIVTDESMIPSDGQTIVWVVDPSQVTGLGYTVSFNADMTWNLVDSRGDTIAANIVNQSGDDAYQVYDGLMVKAIGPDPGINTNIPGPFGDEPGYNGWNYEGTRWVSWGINWGGSTWAGSMGNGIGFFGSTLIAVDYVDTELRFAGADATTQPDRWSRGAVYRRDLGYAYDGIGDIPIVAWDLENDRRLNICFVEDDRIAPANATWDMGWNSADSTFASEGGDDRGGREYLFIMNSTYNEGADYDDDNWGPASDVMYAIWPGERVSGKDHPYLEGTWEMQIYASNVNTIYDQYTFTAPDSAPIQTAYLKEDLKKIKVVPNPYYGYHKGEMDPFDQWVQFTHLPKKCTVRFFDLGGNLIRKLEKNDASTSLLKWNLKNEYELPVASGIYVFHIKAPGIGEKIGKMAIFMPKERLDTY